MKIPAAGTRGLAPAVMASASVQLSVARPLGDARSFDPPSNLSFSNNGPFVRKASHCSVYSNAAPDANSGDDSWSRRYTGYLEDGTDSITG